MFQVNLLIITEFLQTNLTIKIVLMLINTKAVRFGQLIFSIVILFAFVSCQESGAVGAGFVDESEIVVDTIFVADQPFTSTNAYTGKLTYSPVGSFSDPLFGDIEAIGLFKPSIIQGDIGDLPSTVEAILRLDVDINNVYGEQSDNGTFQIFRVGELWRGSAAKIGDDIEIQNNVGNPLQTVVAEFEYVDIDTTGIVEIQLTGQWKNDFVGFYNNDDADRDSVYRFEDFGLAIVPDTDVDKIIYPRFSTSRLILIDTEDQDTTTNIMLDWAYDLDITGGATPAGNITLSNTFNPFVTINFAPLADQLNNNNFVRAELVLTPDSLSLSGSITNSQLRTDNPPFRLQLGPSEDVAYDLGFNITNSRATIDGGAYRFDVTGLFNAYLFGETDISEIYLYAGQNQGYLGFNSFYGFNADRAVVPRILVYNLEESE